jgi:hypothetical protein
MDKTFKKSVLVNAMEYDRLRQRQLREYQPDLSRLAKLQGEIHQTLFNKKIPDQEKSALVAELENQFTKLKKELGVLSSGLVSNSSVDDEPKIQQETSPTPPSPPEDDALPKNDAFPLSYEDLALPDLGGRKAKKLLQKFANNPNIIRANVDGELIVNGEAVPGSNYLKLVRSLFLGRGRRTGDQRGMPELFTAMRQLQVRPTEFSSKAMGTAYTRYGQPREEVEPPAPRRSLIPVLQRGKGPIISKFKAVPSSNIPYRQLDQMSGYESDNDDIILQPKTSKKDQPNNNNKRGLQRRQAIVR